MPSSESVNAGTNTGTLHWYADFRMPRPFACRTRYSPIRRWIFQLHTVSAASQSRKICCTTASTWSRVVSGSSESYSRLYPARDRARAAIARTSSSTVRTLERSSGNIGRSRSLTGSCRSRPVAPFRLAIHLLGTSVPRLRLHRPCKTAARVLAPERVSIDITNAFAKKERKSEFLLHAVDQIGRAHV